MASPIAPTSGNVGTVEADDQTFLLVNVTFSGNSSIKTLKVEQYQIFISGKQVAGKTQQISKHLKLYIVDYE